MKQQPVVSIIVPVYNVEKYLRRCLDSILAQTFDNWEAICVNDGSPDGCDKILDQYAARDKRFRIINQKNGGLSAARNAGMRVSRGEYILFVDSDDFIHPQTLELTVAAARHHNADMVSFRHDRKYYKTLKRALSHNADITGISPRGYTRRYTAAHGFVTDNILFHATERNHGLRSRRPVQHHCMVWRNLCRRELIADVPFIPGIIMEDFPWWGMVMLRRPRTVILPLPLYYYIPNPASILNSMRAARMMDSIATGVASVYMVYHANATIAEFNYFNREFLWPFVITSMRKLAAIGDGTDRDRVRRHVRTLWDAGVFDMPPHWRARKYRRRIWEFINE